jgi:hypothetical protein
MRAVLIVLVQIPADIFSRFHQVTILRTPDFLFLQAAMEPLDLAVAFRVIVGVQNCTDPRLRRR